MESVVLVIHLVLALAIIALVLLQRSEGGGLGIGGGNGGLGGFASARGTANALTKMTAICAACFFITSLSLGVIASQKHDLSQGILEDVAVEDIQAPVADDEISAPTVTHEMPGEIPVPGMENGPDQQVEQDEELPAEEPQGNKPTE